MLPLFIGEKEVNGWASSTCFVVEVDTAIVGYLYQFDAKSRTKIT